MRDGVNVVAYVNANPVNLSDPYGTTGIGETISNIMSFINNNRGLVAGLIMDLMGPLEGVLDLMSAATGKDITGWLHGGMNGSPESMGWWDRACAAAGAAVKIAAGGLRLLSKLKGVLRKIEEIVEKAWWSGGDRHWLVRRVVWAHDDDPPSRHEPCSVDAPVSTGSQGCDSAPARSAFGLRCASA